MEAHLLHFIILEFVVNLHHHSIGIFSDNTPTVAWSTKLFSNRSQITRRLLYALFIRLHGTKCSPLKMTHLARSKNIPLDNASRWFISHLKKAEYN